MIHRLCTYVLRLTDECVRCSSGCTPRRFPASNQSGPAACRVAATSRCSSMQIGVISHLYSYKSSFPMKGGQERLQRYVRSHMLCICVCTFAARLQERIVELDAVSSVHAVLSSEIEAVTNHFNMSNIVGQVCTMRTFRQVHRCKSTSYETCRWEMRQQVSRGNVCC
jgi:hypothetical protein